MDVKRKNISDKLYAASASMRLLHCGVQNQNLTNKVVLCDTNNKMQQRLLAVLSVA